MDKHIMTTGELLQLLRMADPNARIMIHYADAVGENTCSITDVAPYYGPEMNMVSLLTWPVWNSPWKAVNGGADVQVSERYWPMAEAKDLPRVEGK
jgi:hypothetical protein